METTNVLQSFNISIVKLYSCALITPVFNSINPEQKQLKHTYNSREQGMRVHRIFGLSYYFGKVF